MRAFDLETTWETIVQRIQSELSGYIKQIDQFNDLHQKTVDLKAVMTKPIQIANEHLEAILGDLVDKQADLYIEGEDLTGAEAEMMNVARDFKIFLLRLELYLQQYIYSGKEEYLVSS